METKNNTKNRPSKRDGYATYREIAEQMTASGYPIHQVTVSRTLNQINKAIVSALVEAAGIEVSKEAIERFAKSKFLFERIGDVILKAEAEVA